MITVADFEQKTGIVLDEWQKEVVEAKEPQLILCCGRKCGKTVALAAKITIDALNEEFSYSDGILILSKGLRQAREVFLIVRAFLSHWVVWSKSPEANEGYASMTMLKLPSGNKIYSLPSGFDGVTLRTYSFWKIYRDEDAFIPDAVDTAVGACLAVHGVQEIRASTPCGRGGSFFGAWQNENYRHWHRKTEMCPRITKEFLAKEKRRMTKVEYQQEYEAEFRETADGIYMKALIAACQQGFDVAKMREQAQAIFIGVDFARFGEDVNAIAIAYLVDGRLYIRAEEISSHYRTTHIVGAVMRLWKDEKKVRCVVTDEGGVGAGATDMLIEQLGHRKVIGIANQRRIAEYDHRGKYMKAELHSNLLKMMENGKIVFDDDISIRRSLMSMKYKYTKMGDMTIFGHDSHIAEAIVRAAFPLMQKRNWGAVWIDFVPLSTEKAIY